PISKPKGWPDVITQFLRSLAQNWDGKLVAVIVSGLDADGAEALGEIKEAGGITIAQAPDTAEWSDMPASAIKTGYIDHLIPLIRRCSACPIPPHIHKLRRNSRDAFRRQIGRFFRPGVSLTLCHHSRIIE